MQVVCLSSLLEIDAPSWNELVERTASSYPFLRHEFLLLLEQSGAVGANTGWVPNHLLFYEGDELVAHMANYEKSHSMGEFVFDFSWADASHRAGIPYYPKWVSAIPHMPVPGARICLKDDSYFVSVINALTADLYQRQSISSWHGLFISADQAERLRQQDVQDIQDIIVRSDVHFHWFNRNYSDFNDFLQTLTARKRKIFRKERSLIEKQGIKVSVHSGAEITTELCEQMFMLYEITHLKRRGGLGYLTREFFKGLVELSTVRTIIVAAYVGDQLVAASLFFADEHALYGRYWGCYEEYEMLHFECCYYQAIEICIDRGLKRCDAGVQGQHKLRRGFVPTWTQSCHWLRHPGLSHAVREFTDAERVELEGYAEHCQNALPYNDQHKAYGHPKPI